MDEAIKSDACEIIPNLIKKIKGWSSEKQESTEPKTNIFILRG